MTTMAMMKKMLTIVTDKSRGAAREIGEATETAEGEARAKAKVAVAQVALERGVV
jgi:hypothetical protein